MLDAGGGAARLADALLARGFTDVTVLDVSQAALALSRARLGAAAGRVTWITADLTAWTPLRRYALWHDRAVFHFLTDRAGQDAYLDALRAGVAPGGTAIIGGFAPDGPARCSGLPVRRWLPAELAARVGAPFTLTWEEEETHLTPAGVAQRFGWAVLRRDR